MCVNLCKPTSVSKKRKIPLVLPSLFCFETESLCLFPRSDWQVVNKFKIMKDIKKTEEPIRNNSPTYVISYLSCPFTNYLYNKGRQIPKKGLRQKLLFFQICCQARSPKNLHTYFYTIVVSKLITLQKVSRNHWLSKNVHLVNVHKYKFFLYAKEMKAWITWIPEDSNRIEVWLDIIWQISLFINMVSLFSACMTKAICADPSFRKYWWTAEEIDTLLHLIKVYVEAAKLACNRCEEFLNLINWEWGVDIEEYIQCKGLVECTLKLIASVVKRCDVFNLKTGLFLVNIQAFRQIMERKTFYLRQLFLIL